ncbi:MAG: AAA-like domain-containing protein [Deltaproteobacteria bacterium]|nr:AAA-like domain-containing protein [Deltaproteobacteria bacterium]
MPRFFNTAGPCDPVDHYMLPAERRLAAVLELVERKQYFVVHAARQTGKTTSMRALAAVLRARGVAAVHASVESSRGMDDLAIAEGLWMAAIHGEAAIQLPPGQRPAPPPEGVQGGRLGAFLRAWSAALAPVPLVLFLDEVDSVASYPLVNLLSQLRAGFPSRPAHAPASVALVGMRDLRDYLVTAKDGAPVNSGSPFNVKAKSLTLRNFTLAEVGELYGQHEADTGQAFTPEAVALAHALTGGQPFLVNALAAECVDTLVTDRGTPITALHVDAARQSLVLARTTHLDSLAQRLREPRVAAVMQAVLIGGDEVPVHSDDFAYCVDLGLVHPTARPAEVSCPIYREVIARELALTAQDNLVLPRARWLRADGTLDAPVLVAEFLQWWRESSDFAVRHAPEGYREATVHLAFMAFLQKVVNGGGQIHREFAAGSGRVDLCVEMAGARTVIELKRVRPDRGTLDRAIRDGVQQLGEYLDTMGEREGWLILFDQREGLSWEDRTWSEDRVVEGRTLHLRGA